MENAVEKGRGNVTLLLLVFTLVLGMLMGLSSSALAEEPEPNPIEDEYTIDGVTYYNAGSDSFSQEPTDYLREVLENRTSSSLELNGFKRSMADLWLETAAGLIHGKDVTGVGIFTVNIDEAARQSNNSFSKNYQAGSTTYNLTATRYPMSGMHTTDMESLKNAEQYVLNKAGISGNGYFSNQETKQTVLVGALKSAWTNSTQTSNDFRVAAVYFTNFKIVALFPKDEGNNYVTTIIKDASSSTKAFASNVRNNTGTSATGSQKISTSYTASMSNTISKSETYTYQESVTIGNEFSSGLFNKAKLDLSFTASQAFQKGWSTSEALSETNDVEQSVSVELPPFTNVMMSQSTLKADYLTRYNCPVGITYDATIVIYDKNGVYNDMVFTYTGSARTALGKRYQEYKGEREDYDPDGVRWYWVTQYDTDNTYPTYVENAIENISTHIPMSPAGAELRETVDVVYGEVAGVAPIYPLKKIKLTPLNIPLFEDEGTYNNYNYLEMTIPVGKSTYTKYFTVSGYNEKDVPYFGFSGDCGGFKIVDENGDEWTGDDAPVVIGNENASGYATVTAKKPGTCYMKYFIDETVYNTAERPNDYTKNSDLEYTAVVKITVPDNRSVEVEGSFEGFVDEDPVALDADDNLHASVCDATGMEIDGDVVWEKKEKDGRGIILDGNMVSFTKPGTYHVRARIGDQRSDWVEITAKYRTFDVTFKTQNGKKDQTVAVRKGQTVSAPVVGVTKCEQFTGWFTDEDCKTAYDFETPVTEAITLYGGWLTNHVWSAKYTVDEKATYAATGSQSIHCTVCDAKKPGSEQAIPKLKVKPTKLLKLVAAKKGFTAKWKKGADATGYELQYALNSKFTSGKKTVKITKAGTVSKRIAKLKANKKYYVKIRAYKTFNGKKYYSAWSKAKTVKTK